MAAKPAVKKGKRKWLVAILGAGCLLTVGLAVVGVGAAAVLWFYLGQSGGTDIAGMAEQWTAPLMGDSPRGGSIDSDVAVIEDAGMGAIVGDAIEDGLDDPDVLPPEDAAIDPSGDQPAEVQAPPVEEPVRDDPAQHEGDAAANAGKFASTDLAEDEGAPPTSASVTIDHTPTTLTVVGETLTLRAKTPGHSDCTLKVQYKTTGQSWRSMTMSRSGSSHTQMFSIDSNLAPSFQYYLAATDCGAGLWPADGSRQTVKVF